MTYPFDEAIDLKTENKKKQEILEYLSALFKESYGWHKVKAVANLIHN